MGKKQANKKSGMCCGGGNKKATPNSSQQPEYEVALAASHVVTEQIIIQKQNTNNTNITEKPKENQTQEVNNIGKDKQCPTPTPSTPMPAISNKIQTENVFSPKIKVRDAEESDSENFTCPEIDVMASPTPVDKGAFTSPNTPFFCSQTCPTSEQIKQFSKEIEKQESKPQQHYTATVTLNAVVNSIPGKKFDNVNVITNDNLSNILSPPPPTPNTASRFELEIARREELEKELESAKENKTKTVQTKKQRYAVDFKPSDENSASVSITLDYNGDDSELLEELKEPSNAADDSHLDASFSGGKAGFNKMDKNNLEKEIFKLDPMSLEVDSKSKESGIDEEEIDSVLITPKTVSSIIKKNEIIRDIEIDDQNLSDDNENRLKSSALEAINEQSSSESDKNDGYYYVHTSKRSGIEDNLEHAIVTHESIDENDQIRVSFEKEKEDVIENNKSYQELEDEDDEFYNPALYRGILPIPSKEDRKKKLLVLDLDETLVHSSFSYEPTAELIVNVTITNDATNTVDKHVIYVHKRPFVDEFLSFCTKNFECCIFTASMSVYASAVMEQLDPKHTIKNILCREYCTYMNQVMVKDLKKLGRDLKKTIIVDNAPTSFALQKANGITAVEFKDDKSDTYLLSLMEILREMIEVDDVTTYITNNCLNEYISNIY